MYEFEIYNNDYTLSDDITSRQVDEIIAGITSFNNLKNKVNSLVIPSHAYGGELDWYKLSNFVMQIESEVSYVLGLAGWE